MKKYIALFLYLLSINSYASLFDENLNLSLFKDKSTFFYTKHAQKEGIRILANIPHSPFPEDSNSAYLEVDINCSQPIIFRNYGGPIETSAKSYKLKLTAQQYFSYFKLLPNTNCTIKTYSNFELEKTIYIKSYEEQFNILYRIISDSSDENIRETKLHSDGEDAFNRRVEILYGRKLTQEELKSRDPQLPLNLSPEQLPKFDYLLITTLQINSDFVNHILFRLLAAHAQKGTPVVFVVSDVLIGPKEDALLDWLQKQSSNIKIIRYKFNDSDKMISNFFNGLHRVSHAKIFLTYSKSSVQNNYFIGGGRNMSDRYFFKDKTIFRNEEYTQFDEEKMNPWVHFFDMDFEISSQKLSRDILLNVLDFVEITESNIKSNELLLSVPFKDNMALEKAFIEQINNAHDSIEILSPYIYFTNNMRNALKASAKRGVKIKVILSLSLLGDAMTKQLKNFYDFFINECSSYMDIYQYPTNELTIMHRKALLIDKHSFILGSVNLSQRSFIHDIESAYIGTDPTLAGSLNNEIEEMFLISKKIDGKFKNKLKILENLNLMDLL